MPPRLRAHRPEGEVEDEGLYIPRAVRSDTGEGSLLLSLEIPDCCPLSRECPHLGTADHGVSLEDWRALLRAYDPDGYDPPPPPAPALALTRRARVALLVERARALRYLYHSADGLPLLDAWMREEGTADTEEPLLTSDTPKGELRLAGPDAPAPPRYLTEAEAWMSEDSTAEDLLALFRAGRDAPERKAAA